MSEALAKQAKGSDLGRCLLLLPEGLTDFVHRPFAPSLPALFLSFAEDRPGHKSGYRQAEHDR
jgi:hypothetical protein